MMDERARHIINMSSCWEFFWELCLGHRGLETDNPARCSCQRYGADRPSCSSLACMRWRRVCNHPASVGGDAEILGCGGSFPSLFS